MAELNVLEEQKRQLIEDRNELQDKYVKLIQLLQASNFTSIVPNVDEQCRLKVQCRYMELYANILNERIEHFDETLNGNVTDVVESEPEPDNDKD